MDFPQELFISVKQRPFPRHFYTFIPCLTCSIGHHLNMFYIYLPMHIQVHQLCLCTCWHACMQA